MNILLDTSFLLPFIQVEPSNISGKKLKMILNKQEHTYAYCELSIFELVAKGMKICHNSELTINEIRAGIDTLVYRSPLQSINWKSHPNLFEIAYTIRNEHNDTLDCLIFTTALYFSDCFATADNTLLKNIKNNEVLAKQIISTNPRFYLWLDDLKKPPILLSKLLETE
ncbi:hypothetical protein [Candidatus Harpocratesius sp.]